MRMTGFYIDSNNGLPITEEVCSGAFAAATTYLKLMHPDAQRARAKATDEATDINKCPF